jgi:REP element-mobilizing transposase RayT
MQFHENELYHVYNRGNRRQTTFFNNENYIYFLQKVRKYILPHCNILNYCLMPNHFHFLIYTDTRTIQTAKLVPKMEDWSYSSFKDYLGIRNGTICNKQLAYELIELNPKTFYEDSYRVIDNNDLLNNILEEK